MNILQMHNRYVYPGGEDAVAAGEAAMLRRFGHKVIELQRDNKTLNALAASAKARFYLKDAFFCRETYNAVRRLIEQERPDVAHAHNSFFLLGPAAYEACFDAGVPVVQTLHNYRFLCAAATFYRAGSVCEQCLHGGPWPGIIHGCWHSSPASSAYMTAVIATYKCRNILGRIKKFIALSSFSRQKFIEGGFNASRIEVKPNFVDAAAVSPAPIRKYVLYVGALQPYKGISTLLAAWKGRTWPMPLKIAGTGPLAAAIPGEKASGIDYLGQVESAAVMDLMRGAVCVVVPSECYENFPRTIIEAYACGTPVVASRLGALAELVRDGETGKLFTPGQPEELAQCLAGMMKDLEQANKMGSNGRRLFEDQYTMDANYTQLMRIYTCL